MGAVEVKITSGFYPTLFMLLCGVFLIASSYSVFAF